MIGRRLFRTILILGSVAVIASCGGRQSNFIEQVLRSGLGPVFEGEPEPQTLPTRAQLDAIGRPILSIQREDSPATGFVIAVNANSDGYVIYQDQARNSVVVRGGLLTGTQGFEYDLSAIKVQGNDPVVHRTPIASWPKTLVRNYQFSLQHAADFQISVSCVLRTVVREQVEIFSKSYDTMRVQEDCNNTTRRFTNLYWVDANSGFIWKSKQWIGPKVSPVIVQNVTPYRRPDAR